MNNSSLFFQYCQKIVLFNESRTAILLARRKGEADYDGVYSLIGGKMETTDGGFLQGLTREKNEEIGPEARVAVYPQATHNIYFVKKDCSAMVLPHYYAEYRGGEINLNEEYSDYKWVNLDKLAQFEPKIETIEPIVGWALKLQKIIEPRDLVTI